MSNPYKTHWYHRQAGHWFRKAPERAPGAATAPECIRLDAEGAGNGRPPVRIFLGTEPGQYRATRVFVWSVMKHRDPAQAYEIHLMSDLADIARDGWKTGFTNYRYAIPALAGNAGRAIYNDVDQIYLSDPAGLFFMEMDGKGVLAISEAENSVMLIDCAVMAPLWTLDDVKAGRKHAHFKGAMMAADLLGPMPGTWNARDGEYPVEETDCLHYTTLHTQPWKPFPEMLRYAPNPLGPVWHELEAEADRAGYLMFTRGHPTQDFARLEALNAQITPASGAHDQRVAALIVRTGAQSVLEVGYGGATSVPDGVAATQARPSAMPEGQRFGGVVAAGMLERLPPLDVPWVLAGMFAMAEGFVFVAVDCEPSGHELADGSDTHATVMPPYWWHTQMALAGRQFPGVHWALRCTETGTFGKSHTRIDRDGPSPLE